MSCICEKAVPLTRALIVSSDYTFMKIYEELQRALKSIRSAQKKGDCPHKEDSGLMT